LLYVLISKKQPNKEQCYVIKKNRSINEKKNNALVGAQKYPEGANKSRTQVVDEGKHWKLIYI